MPARLNELVNNEINNPPVNGQQEGGAERHCVHVVDKVSPDRREPIIIGTHK